MDEPQSHLKLVPSLKPWQSLCSFRWLKLSLNLDRSFITYALFTEKTEFDFILINGDILTLDSLHESIFCKSGSRPFHNLMQQGKNDDWKILVLQIGSSKYPWLDGLQFNDQNLSLFWESLSF